MESPNIQQGIIIEKVSGNNYTLEIKELSLPEATDSLLSAYCKTVKRLVQLGLLTPKLAKDVTIKQLEELLGEE